MCNKEDMDEGMNYTIESEIRYIISEDVAIEDVFDVAKISPEMQESVRSVILEEAKKKKYHLKIVSTNS